MTLSSVDDFLIDENPVYALSILKQFLRKRKIVIEDEEELVDEPAALEVTEVKEEKNGKLNVRYEYAFDVEGEKFKEVLELGVTIGQGSGEKLAVCFDLQGGNRLYYKKVLKEIKKLYANCLA